MFRWFRNWFDTIKENARLYAKIICLENQITRLEGVLNTQAQQLKEARIQIGAREFVNQVMSESSPKKGLYKNSSEGRMSTLTWHEEKLLRIELSHYKESCERLLKILTPQQLEAFKNV